MLRNKFGSNKYHVSFSGLCKLGLKVQHICEIWGYCLQSFARDGL